MRKKNTPLRRYLEETGMTYEQFAMMLTQSRGWRAYHTHVCSWATGHTLPGNATRAAIAKATHGKVPATAWK